MRRGGRAAFQLVEVHHVQAVACARVVLGAFGCAQRSAQRQPPDATHAIDADSQDRSSIEESTVFRQVSK
jgi:hypothetical protein